MSALVATQDDMVPYQNCGNDLREFAMTEYYESNNGSSYVMGILASYASRWRYFSENIRLEDEYRTSNSP